MKLLGVSTLVLATALFAVGPAQAQQSTQGQQQGTQQQTQAGSDQQTQAGGSPAEPGEIRPLTITCQDIVDTDVKLVPQLVYWIDGYNVAYDASTGQTDVDPVVTVKENWLTVPAQNVITACEAEPTRAAADVITEQKQKAESGTN